MASAYNRGVGDSVIDKSITPVCQWWGKLWTSVWFIGFWELIRRRYWASPVSRSCPFSSTVFTDFSSSFHWFLRSPARIPFSFSAYPRKPSAKTVETAAIVLWTSPASILISLRLYFDCNYPGNSEKFNEPMAFHGFIHGKFVSPLGIIIFLPGCRLNSR